MSNDIVFNISSENVVAEYDKQSFDAGQYFLPLHGLPSA